MGTDIQRIRHAVGTVLPQEEVRNYVYDPDNLAWEAAQTNYLLTAILAKLEEIRVLLGGT